MRSAHVTLALLSSISLALGCARGSAGGEPDGGRPMLTDSGPRPDGGRFDAGDPRLDSGMPADDAAPRDAGPPIDGAPPTIDGGRPEPDGGPPIDGGPLCAGVDCSAMTTACTVGVCQPATGTCSAMARSDGTTCDDGDPCTSGDRCSAGACSGAGAVDCSSMSTECAIGVCRAAAGGCTTMPAMDGIGCGMPGSCSASGTCMGGSCMVRPAIDCASCGAGMVCAGGACGAPPTELRYDFESGALPTGWMNGIGGTASWSVISGGARGGTYRVRSGMIGASAQSRMGFSITLSAPAALTFWLTTSSESGYDFLEVYVDGARRGQWSGTTPWTQASVGLAAGARTIEFRYVKDSSIDSGSDTVWIDDVAIGAETNPNTGFEGSSTLPAGYTTSGTTGWVVVTSGARSGANAAASGVISHSQTTSMTRTVTAPSATTLTFWYRVSSEPSYDFLRVFIDGVQQGQWSGDVPWAMASYPLAAGTHTVEWRYLKDGSVSTGSDRAWVDDVDFGFVPVPMPICM